MYLIVMNDSQTSIFGMPQTQQELLKVRETWNRQNEPLFWLWNALILKRSQHKVTICQTCYQWLSFGWPSFFLPLSAPPPPPPAQKCWCQQSHPMIKAPFFFLLMWVDLTHTPQEEIVPVNEQTALLFPSVSLILSLTRNKKGGSVEECIVLITTYSPPNQRLPKTDHQPLGWQFKL